MKTARSLAFTLYALLVRAAAAQSSPDVVVGGQPSGSAMPPPLHIRDGSVTLKKEDWAEFDRAIKAIATQGKIAIVAEGVPLAKAERGGEEPAETLSLDDAVAEVAERFDYAVALDKSARSVVRLQKRYTLPIDIPCVPPEEWALALRDMADIVRPVEPTPPVDDNQKFVTDFSRSLTPEQRDNLKADALPVASLTESQKRDIWRLLATSYSDDRANFENVRFLLRRMDQMDVGFGKYDGKTYFDLSIYYEVTNPDGSRDGNTGGIGGVPYEP